MTTYSNRVRRDRSKKVVRILWAILALNILVALAKFIYGKKTYSASMQADGIHSFFDGISNIVGIVGISLASKPPDKTHPYGHRKFETYASIAIGIMLIFAAYNIFSTAVLDFMHGNYQIVVDIGSFTVMIVTLIINFSVTSYEHYQAKKLKSEILNADAKHTLSDVLVSLSVIIGLIFTKHGYPVADSIVSFIVAGAIAFAAYGIFKQAGETLSDQARIPPENLRKIALSMDGVRNAHAIRTRGTEGEVWLDMHLLVDPNMTVMKSHALLHDVEHKIMKAYPQIVDSVIHVEPDIPEERVDPEPNIM